MLNVCLNNFYDKEKLLPLQTLCGEERKYCVEYLHRKIKELELDSKTRSLCVEMLDCFYNETNYSDYIVYIDTIISICDKYIRFILNKDYLPFVNVGCIFEIISSKLNLPTTSGFVIIYLHIFQIDFDQKILDDHITHLELSSLNYKPSIVALSLIYKIVRHFSPDLLHKIEEKLHLTAYNKNDIVKFLDTLHNGKSSDVYSRKGNVHESSFVVVNRYKVLKRIGSGNYSNIYKILYEDEEICTKISSKFSLYFDSIVEIANLEHLRDNNILEMKIFFKDRFSDRYCIATKLMQFNLYEYIYNQETCTEISKMSIIEKLLEGIYYLHSNGLVHGDIKPENILLSEDQVKIADFGLSRNIVYSLENRSIVGSAVYSPIEYLYGYREYSFSFDIWSCGAVIAELLKGGNIFLRDEEMNCSINYLMRAIFRVLGTDEEIMKVYYPKFIRLNLEGYDLNEHIVDDDKLVTLVRSMLSLDPKEREDIRVYLDILI